MLRYDLFYLMAALLASPVVAARLARGKWRTDWRGRFGHVGAPDVQALPTDDAPRRPVHSAGRSAGHTAGEVSAAPARPQPPTVLVHGVSVGEVAATRQLVDLLAARARVVVSSTTDTGIARARLLYGNRHAVVRYPIDLSWMVRRYLDAVRPDLVALTELEVWPNFVTECTRRGIPVCVVNGRMSASSYRGYRRARRWVQPLFRQLAAVAAQSEAYARRFADLGVPRNRVRVTDTMKWDTSGQPRTDPPTTAAATTPPAAEAHATELPRAEALPTESAASTPPAAEALAATLGLDRSRPLIVAGSTGPGEEKELIATRPPAAQLLLVPRKPERFDTVAALDPAIRRRSRARSGSRDPEGIATVNEAVPPLSGHSASRANKAAPPPSGQIADRAHPLDLFLLDTMGELELAYALADVAIVGRSFAPMGGSDPIPPVAAGCATIIGPHHENFADVVSALREGGGITVTSAPKEAMEAAALLLQDVDARRQMARRGRRVIRRRRGASARGAELVLGLLGERTRTNPEYRGTRT